MTADAAFLRQPGASGGRPADQLAVGNGGVALPVAQAAGRPVIGIDTSPGMLDQARQRAAAAGAELELHPWSAFAFDHRIATSRDGVHQDHPLPHTARYAAGSNRLQLVLDDGATSSLWRAARNERLGLVDVAGLEVEALYGGFAHEPFDDDSRECVSVTRR